VLIDAISWLDEHLIANQREWVAQAAEGRRLTWHSISKLAREVGVRARGHFGGEPGEADAAAARRAILFLLATVPNLNAIVLVRDQDDQPERRAGLEQARADDRSGVVIVIGLAVVERGVLGDQRLRPAERARDSPVRCRTEDPGIRPPRSEP